MNRQKEIENRIFKIASEIGVFIKEEHVNILMENPNEFIFQAYIEQGDEKEPYWRLPNRMKKTGFSGIEVKRLKEEYDNIKKKQ